MNLNDLTGIPWKLNGRSLKGTDCIGIIVLYFLIIKRVKNKNPFFTRFFRLRRFHKPDRFYLERILDGYGKRVPKEKIIPDDIIVFDIRGEIHAGILLRFNKFFHSVPSVGSCIERLRDDYWTHLQYGVRLNA